MGVGTLAYGASILLYVAGAQQLGATRAQMVFATAPFWGVLLGWVPEPILAAQAVAGALMAGGLALIYGERHVHAHRHEAIRHQHRHRHDDGHHDHPHRPDLHHRYAHRGDIAHRVASN